LSGSSVISVILGTVIEAVSGIGTNTAIVWALLALIWN